MARRPTCASNAIAGGAGPAAAAGPWPIEIEGLTLELRATEAGQVGLFPEHAAMLPWLRRAGRRRASRDGGDAPAVLHLFAYTGLATLAMAAAGAAVTHVDASRPTVTWARHNADRSGLADRPVRWIVDDAVAFSRARGPTRPPLRRGRPRPADATGTARSRRVADRGRTSGRCSPSCGRLLEPDGFVLLTAHTPGFDEDRLAGALGAALAARAAATVDAGELALATADGRRLELGAFARSPGRA